MTDTPLHVEAAEAHPLTQPVRYLSSRLQVLASYASSKPTAELSGNAKQPKPCDNDEARSDEATPAASPTSRRKPNKSFYHFCHPPPSARAHRSRSNAPKLMLQLRRAGSTRGAPPELELYPAQAYLKHTRKPNLAVTGKAFIVEDDLIVAACEDGEFNKPALQSKGPGSAGQEIVSVIHRLDCSNADCEDIAAVALEAGLLAANKMEGGGYEFTIKNPDGPRVVARWARRCSKDEADQRTAPGPWFKFLLVSNVNKRKYAVGSLDRLSIMILDMHTSASTAPAANEADSSAASVHTSGESDAGVAAGQETVVETSPELKKLILVTGIWVAVNEGWIPAVKAAPAGTEATAGRPRRSSQVLLGRTLGELSSSNLNLPKRRFSANILTTRPHQGRQGAAASEQALVSPSFSLEDTRSTEVSGEEPESGRASKDAATEEESDAAAGDSAAGDYDAEAPASKEAKLRMRDKLKMLMSGRQHTA